MRIAVTGSTGLIGTALVRSLRADGHEVVRLVRRTPPATEDEVRVGPPPAVRRHAGLDGLRGRRPPRGRGRRRPPLDRRVQEGDPGQPGAGHGRDRRGASPRWTCRRGCCVSRQRGRLLRRHRGPRRRRERAARATVFCRKLCQEWEEAAAAAEEAGVRTVFARTGLVVARKGGAWGRLFPLFKAGLGGPAGQRPAVLELHRPARPHRRAAPHPGHRRTCRGPVNLTAPQPVTNREVTAAMGRVLRRPTLFPVPAPALRIALGEMARDVLGSSAGAAARLLESGFTFAFPQGRGGREVRRWADGARREPCRRVPGERARCERNGRTRLCVPPVRAPVLGRWRVLVSTVIWLPVPVGTRPDPPTAPTSGRGTCSSAARTPADVIIVGAGQPGSRRLTARSARASASPSWRPRPRSAAG